MAGGPCGSGKGLNAGNELERVERSGVEGVQVGGNRERMGVENSASVRAAASIELSQSVSVNKVDSIQEMSDEIKAAERER